MDPSTKQRLLDSIVPPERMLDANGRPEQMGMMHIFHLNCYAYALGILHFEPGISFCAGFMKDNDSKKWEDGKINPKTLESLIESDLAALGLPYRKFSLQDKIDLRENEYLIKWYASDSDLHYFRQDPTTGVWFHKPGRMARPQTIGKEPGDRVEMYQARGYFAISTIK